MPLATLSKYVGLGPNKEETTKNEVEFNPRKKYGRKQIFMTWEALARSPKKETSLKLSRSLTMTGIVIGLLLVVMQEFIPLLFIVSIIFVNSALAKVPPEKTRYEISNYGITLEEVMYHWKDLVNFYFDTSEGLDVLSVNTRLGFPGRLFITLQKGDKEKIQKYLEERIDFMSGPPQTIFDRGYQKVLGRFDLE